MCSPLPTYAHLPRVLILGHVCHSFVVIALLDLRTRRAPSVILAKSTKAAFQDRAGDQMLKTMVIIRSTTISEH